MAAGGQTLLLESKAPTESDKLRLGLGLGGKGSRLRD